VIGIFLQSKLNWKIHKYNNQQPHKTLT